MATYASCYALTSARQKSNPSYSVNTARAVGDNPDFVEQVADVQSRPLNMGIVRPSAWAMDPVTIQAQFTCPFRSFVGLANTGTPAQYAWYLGAEAQGIGTYYYVNADPTAVLVGYAITFETSEGRMAPRPSVRAQLQDGISIVSGVVTWSDVIPYTSDQNIIVFDDVPPASLINGGGFPSTLLRDLYIDPPVRVSAGSTTLDFCSAAGIAPDGTIWIDPADIGNGADQIPASVGNNTAAAFRAHPSCFIPSGASRYIRAVDRMAIDREAINATTVGQPFRIRTVDNAPQASRWLVAIDGAETVLRLAHPSGSDYRRPRDIWNNVIVPLIQGAQIGSTLGFSNASALAVAANLKYSNYWRCLEIESDDGGDVTQDDTTPPG